MPAAKKEDVELFSALSNVDVSEHVEEKDTGKAKLKYLSWAWAWYEVRKRCPDATYSIIKNEQGLPYFVDPLMGIMVYTTVTINGETHEIKCKQQKVSALRNQFEKISIELLGTPKAHIAF